MIYKGIYVPQCNRRPQLWYRGDMTWRGANLIQSGIAIVYPSGAVDFSVDFSIKDNGDNWCSRACTERPTQEETIIASIDYSLKRNYVGTVFLGYL